MKPDRFDKLLALVQRLNKARIPYQVETYREDAISVVARAPGEYWEIDFLSTGEIEIERFRSNGKILDDPVLEGLFELCSDDEPTTASLVTENGSAARK